MFIKESAGREFSERQKNCFAEFKDQLLVMNEAEFNFAERLIPNHGRQLLVGFFVTHFKSLDSQTASLKMKEVADAAVSVNHSSQLLHLSPTLSMVWVWAWVWGTAMSMRVYAWCSGKMEVIAKDTALPGNLVTLH